ncbi:MAG: ribonuclease P protein component [Pseudomonadota bacterium]
MDRQTFGKNERIRKKRDFLAVYQQGVRNHSNHFTVIAHRNPSGKRRLGITVGKKVGNAVKRNRLKRLLREFFRLHKEQFPPAQDIVVMAKWTKGARGSMSILSYRDLRLELLGLLQEISHD